ncbi:hypothetical protein HU200_057791 [Digitaria exilis]|uniref:Uncharacterized protein n=1 Tax=Digitaria exilis TaxID=1010633 RepID=A0A835AGJ1_9POAL|nr:hypothetical protein HU200_057791 [Digitaria exilis]
MKAVGAVGVPMNNTCGVEVVGAQQLATCPPAPTTDQAPARADKRCWGRARESDGRYSKENPVGVSFGDGTGSSSHASRRLPAPISLAPEQNFFVGWRQNTHAKSLARADPLLARAKSHPPKSHRKTSRRSSMRQQDKQAAMARELLAASAWREGNAAAAHAQKIAERGGTRCSDGSGWGARHKLPRRRRRRHVSARDMSAAKQAPSGGAGESDGVGRWRVLLSYLSAAAAPAINNASRGRDGVVRGGGAELETEWIMLVVWNSTDAGDSAGSWTVPAPQVAVAAWCAARPGPASPPVASPSRQPACTHAPVASCRHAKRNQQLLRADKERDGTGRGTTACDSGASPVSLIRGDAAGSPRLEQEEPTLRAGADADTREVMRHSLECFSAELTADSLDRARTHACDAASAADACPPASKQARSDAVTEETHDSLSVCQHGLAFPPNPRKEAAGRPRRTPEEGPPAYCSQGRTRTNEQAGRQLSRSFSLLASSFPAGLGSYVTLACTRILCCVALLFRFRQGAFPILFGVPSSLIARNPLPIIECLPRPTLLL